jgi:alkaline phosphatase
MGAGHPEFTDDATPRRTKRDYQYVGGEGTWKRLTSGKHPAGWFLVQAKSQFESLTRDPQPPQKVLGVARVATTLQQARSKGLPPPPGSPAPQPFARRPNPNVPTLETMTAAAVNSLAQNRKGFYLMIEGGAVDWANHARQEDRMVEEQIDFMKALDWVVQWVETKSSWRDTLVIVTADHECGMLWGPDSDSVAFDKIVDRGKNKLPDMRHNSGGHTNSLVPLYARGQGAERFYRYIISTDTSAAAAWGVTGQYVDNTSIFAVMKAEVVGKPRRATAGASTVRAP